MNAKLRTLWESRSPRDRIVIAILAAVVAAALYFLLAQSAYKARAQLGKSLVSLRAQAVRLNTDATEIERLRAIPAPPAAKSELRALVQSRADTAGIARALVRLDAPDAGQVQVVFGAVAFADWLAWVAGLQGEQVRLEASRIEALSTPGMVGVTATFVRTKAQ